MVWPAKCVSSWEIEWITLPGIFTLAGDTLAQACFVLEKAGGERRHQTRASLDLTGG